jgi:hypothetical protein
MQSWSTRLPDLDGIPQILGAIVFHLALRNRLYQYQTQDDGLKSSFLDLPVQL